MHSEKQRRKPHEQVLVGSADLPDHSCGCRSVASGASASFGGDLMERLIDANRMQDGQPGEFDKNLDFCDYSDLQEWVDNQPTVDAVEVVRCKDCARASEKDGIFMCGYFGCWMDPCEFCSQGERKE